MELQFGLLFDFFRILRKSFKTRDIVTYIQDIIFWIFTGIIILYTIFVYNNGKIRLYMFLAISVGILLYMLLFSKYIIKINVSIIRTSKKIISRILYMLFTPLKIIYKTIRKLLHKPVSFIIINIRKCNITKYKK